MGNVEEMGKIIKSRLEKAGCEIEEMYAIMHDKDEKRLWNEYKKAYDTALTSSHGHFVVKFQKGKGKTLPELASAVGLEENYIEKPHSGRYAYDNMLSYLIHIKYDKKYQYSPSSVYTIAGKDYMEYNSERHESWVKGKAKKTIENTKELLNFILLGIASGEIFFNDICLDEEWKKVYALNSAKIDKALEARARVDGQQQYILYDDLTYASSKTRKEYEKIRKKYFGENGESNEGLT